CEGREAATKFSTKRDEDSPSLLAESYKERADKVSSTDYVIPEGLLEPLPLTPEWTILSSQENALRMHTEEMPLRN
ncbi:hypothetical protein AVEN_256009-1, partial [Araneus ventricosus]